MRAITRTRGFFTQIFLSQHVGCFAKVLDFYPRDAHTGYMTNTFEIRSPCHPTAALCVELAWEGPAYVQCQVPDGFYCDAPGCYNAWDVDGNPI